MKKLFFFRSSASNSANNTGESPPAKDRTARSQKLIESEFDYQVNDKYENGTRSPRGLPSKSRSKTLDNQASNGSGLRRSRSLSSSAFVGLALEPTDMSILSDHTGSSVFTPRQADHSSRYRAATPTKKHYKPKHYEEVAPANEYGARRPCSSASSENSSNCSSNVSSKVVDRYIDGEQHQEMSRPKSFLIIHPRPENGTRPPRAQSTAPTSPTYSMRDKPRSHSFREVKVMRPPFSSRDWVENGLGVESPRRIAKSVVDRLNQTSSFTKASSKEVDHTVPITIEDIYGGSLHRSYNSNAEVIHKDNSLLDEEGQLLDAHEQSYLLGKDCMSFSSDHNEDESHSEVVRRYNEAKKRVALFSQGNEQDLFHDISFDLPKVMQTIGNLREEKMSLAVEVSELLQCVISERASSKEKLRQAKVDLELQTRRLEKEKKELQLGLEKELDRRSHEWSSKLEKYQLEEQRLRERVRELAEQNVSLQRSVASFNEKEAESRRMMTYSEQKLKELTENVEQFSQQKQEIEQNLYELQEKYRLVEANSKCIGRNFLEKEKECKELHRSVARLSRTCSEQEKTIEVLREEFDGETQRLQSLDVIDKQTAKLRAEQVRLTGIELALRKELESSRVEIDSLRHENISLLGRLKGIGKGNGDIMFQLDKEMWSRICCLQNQGLSILNDGAHLCSSLLEFIREKFTQCDESKHGMESIQSGLDGQFLVESETRLHGIKCGTENFERSLQMMSKLLDEKANPLSLSSISQVTGGNASNQINDQTPQEILRSELKEERLITSLLREKLYSKELEVEQLQAELATAVRGTDILRYQVQSAMDSLSSVSHKLKDLELQMLKKDENLNHLQSELHESRKEITVMKGILPKVSEERDMMWEEVKQYSEKNMLLNSEVNMLKKKIDALDEDILVKDGQITILKDSLGKKSFDLLGSPDFTREFLLE